MKLDKSHLRTNARKWRVSVTQFVRSHLLLLRAWNILSSRFVLYSLYILTGHYAWTIQHKCSPAKFSFQRLTSSQWIDAVTCLIVSARPSVRMWALKYWESLCNLILEHLLVCQFQFCLITIILTRPARISVHISKVTVVFPWGLRKYNRWCMCITKDKQHYGSLPSRT